MKSKPTAFEENVSTANWFISYVISNHLLIEHLMIDALNKVIPKPDALFRNSPPTFPLLISLCEAHGIIEEDFANVLRKVNSLRNKYAHRMRFEPNDEEIDLLLISLREMNPPFFVSFIEPSERELAIALAGISGNMERICNDLVKNYNVL